MTVTITQVYLCDICGTEIETLKQDVPHNTVPQVINNARSEHVTVRTTYGITPTHDICVDCWVKFCDWWKAQEAKKQ